MNVSLQPIELEGFLGGHDTELWRRLGAHWTGDAVRFTVWAPRARAVEVRGDFNHWQPGNAMTPVGDTGVWQLTDGSAAVGSVYKFAIQGPDGQWREKADPMARQAEGLPATGSIVTEARYPWSDQDWLERRARSRPYAEQVSVYEVHLPSWRPGAGYSEIADDLVAEVVAGGWTHVELIGLAHHPFLGSWGYQVTGYFAPLASQGTPDDLRYLIDRLHRAGVGVLMDFVPGHFATDPWALADFDGTACYEHPDPRRGRHLDWGTHIFDFGRPEVKSFLLSAAWFWIEEFHLDGLRIDAVASMLYLDYSRPAGGWVPNQYGGRENLEAIELLKELNKHLYQRSPGVITVAEESTSWPGVTRAVHEGGLGFGFKWNMGWMNDALRYLGRDPIHRQHHHDEITFAMVYAYSENYVLPISHDEVVHGKGSMYERAPGDDWQKLASLRTFYAHQWSHPGKQLLFMGTEFGQRREFSEERGPDREDLALARHAGLRRLVGDLNRIQADHPALFVRDNEPSGFQWIDADDATSNTFSFLRTDGEEWVAVLVNYSPEPIDSRTLPLPETGRWEEILNTDAEIYGGTGQFGNLGAVTATAEPAGQFPARAAVTIPPLGVLWLRWTGPEAADAGPASGDVAAPSGRTADGGR